MSNTELNEMLKSLTKEEYEAAMKILNEVSNNGTSDTLSAIYSEDFIEVPVDIDTFIDSSEYAGWFTNNGNGIYPYWREELRKIFNQVDEPSEICLTGCLAGDTLIPLLNGKKIPISELSDIGDLDEYVYSFDLETDKYTAGHLIKAFSTGIKDVYRITLDNRESFRVTSNHKFLTRDKHWKSIDTGLSIDDSLMPFNRGTMQCGSTITYNRRIISIEYCGEEEVYDLTVEKYHNFALDCGIVAHNSIGSGKSHIAVLGLAYTLYNLMCIKDPYKYFNLAKGSMIYIVFFNTTLTLSQGVAYTKFQSLLQNSPWFMRHGKVSGSKYIEYIPDGPIAFSTGSQIEHSLGKDIFCMTGDTQILTENGYQSLESLSGKYIRVFYKDNNDNMILTEDPVEIKHTMDTSELYEIELEDGSIIRCTGNHMLLLKSGDYKRADELSESDELADIDVGRISVQRGIKIKSVHKVLLDHNIPVYDVVNVPEYHNFIVKTNTTNIVSHNCAILDEVNFVKGADIQFEKSKIMKLYGSVLERIRSRFTIYGKVRGKLFMVSSKKSEYDFMEQYIKKQRGKSGVHVSDAVLFRVKPTGTYCGEMFKIAVGGSNMPSKIIQDGEDPLAYEHQGYKVEEVPVEFKSTFELNMEDSLMNILGISVSGVTKFLTYNTVSRCYKDIKNPFVSNILTIGTNDKLEIRDFFDPTIVSPELYSKPIFIHLDASVNGDRTGLSATAAVGYRYQDEYNIETADTETTKELIYRHVFSVGIQCPADSEISFQKTRNFIYFLKNTLHWNIVGISTDGFQSVDTRQLLISMGFDDVSLLSLDRTPDGYLAFKSALLDGRISMICIPELETELITLERNNVSGKVDHPEDSSKDIADSLVGSMYNALLHSSKLDIDLSETAGNIIMDVNNYDSNSNSILDHLVTTNKVTTINNSSNILDENSLSLGDYMHDYIGKMVTGSSQTKPELVQVENTCKDNNTESSDTNEDIIRAAIARARAIQNGTYNVNTTVANSPLVSTIDDGMIVF